MPKIYKDLEQFDYPEDEYLEKVKTKYSQLIGLFIIDFSYLEHDLNCAIAERFYRGAYEIGYIVIEKFSMHNKIDLFYKLYCGIESLTDKKTKTKLNEIKSELLKINTFRNSIAHANWQTLDKKKFVRTKIAVDSEDGFVKLKNIQITPKIIRDNIKVVDNLMCKIFKYRKKQIAFK